MSEPFYILDTNVVSDIIADRPSTMGYVQRFQPSQLLLPYPVSFEILHGLTLKDAVKQRSKYESLLNLLLTPLPLVFEDWKLAAQLWADMRRTGKQLSDMDLLIAAMTLRLEAVLVTSDLDFVPLGITTENWRS